MLSYVSECGGDLVVETVIYILWGCFLVGMHDVASFGVWVSQTGVCDTGYLVLLGVGPFI